MLKRIFQSWILFSIVLSPIILLAQQTFREGYVVKGNDTTRGYLKEDIESNLINGVTFSTNASGTPNSFYTAADIKAFYFKGENVFQLVSFAGTNGTPLQYFVKVMLRGYYDLYSFSKEEQLYFVVAGNDTNYLLYDDRQFVNGEMNQKGNFKNILRFLSNDCSNVNSRLDGMTYNERNIINYITDLNACKAPMGSSTNYYIKSKPKMNIYAYAGALPLGNQSQYAGRVIARFSLPSVSKNTFINTGIAYNMRTNMETFYYQYSRPKKKERKYNVLSAGLTLQNNFTTGIVQPYLEAGLGFAYKKEEIPKINLNDLRRKYGLDVIAAVGVEGFITSRLVAKVDWRYELVVNFPTIGIAYFFK